MYIVINKLTVIHTHQFLPLVKMFPTYDLNVSKAGLTDIVPKQNVYKIYYFIVKKYKILKCGIEMLCFTNRTETCVCVLQGVIDTAQTLCDVASRGHEQKGLPGAVGGVLRQIPPTVVRPLIVASEATSNLLGGMRNQIKPDARKEDFLKWRTEDGQE